jgi:hypothetical protein
MLTWNQLHAWTSYDPEVGVFKSLGVVDFSRHPQDARGYIYIIVNGERYYEHRLAWFYMTGKWPKDLDHRDKDKGNNRFANLREATRSQNMHNLINQKSNKSGVRGVHWDMKNQRWRVQLHVDGKCHSLGRFNTLKEALVVRNEAAAKLHGEFYTEARL